MGQYLIPPKYYYDENHFNLEIETIFKSKWLFGCLTTEISKKNDYFLVEIGKYSVILFNNGSEIVALQNLCTHRFNRIFTNPKGNSPLVCKFHSWCFDGCGLLKNKQIAKTEELCKQFSLKRYSVEIIGKFIFFNMDINFQEKLYDQLAGIEEELLLVSEIIDYKFHQESNFHKVNWKFICENVIDVTHCLSLHQETLVKIGYCKEPIKSFVLNGSNSLLKLPPQENNERKKRDKFINKKLPRKNQNNEYKHIFIYPNLTIGVYEGLNITIGSILPQNSVETNYNLHYYFAEILNKNDQTKNLLEIISSDVINFGNKVFDEDKIILENVQKGVLEADQSGYVYENELRIKSFFESYHKSLKHV
jgi:choline monooxygenase